MSSSVLRISASCCSDFPSASTRRAIDSLGEVAEGRVTLHASGDARVRGDELWIARALINLIENGLSHGERDSRLTVEVSRSEEWVNLRVVSRGSISRHVRERLFRRFVTTRADKGGTGLGLAIVRAVTEAHGGQVELLNAGPPEVVFLVSLPPARRRAALQLLNAVQDARQELAASSKIDQ